jgi:hypothetical protein
MQQFGSDRAESGHRADIADRSKMTHKRRILVDCRVSSFSPFDCENTPFAGDTLEGLAAAVAEA